MRSPLGIIIIGFVLLIALGILVNHYIRDSATELAWQLEKLDLALNNEQWEQAKSDFEEIKLTWETTQKYWMILLNHQEIETIDERFNRLSQYIEHQSLTLSVGELAIIRKLVDHIFDTETFSLVNLL